MDLYALEELARTIMRERQQEARRTRPHTEARPRPDNTLGHRIARALLHMAPWLEAALSKGFPIFLAQGQAKIVPSVIWVTVFLAAG